MVGPWVFFLEEIVGEREWYEDDTISVDKTGINGTIQVIGSSTTADSTIIVDKTGLIGTTTDV